MRNVGWVAVVALACATWGCREPRTTSELVAELRNPDPGARQSAADDLRQGNDCLDAGAPPCVPPEAIPPLLEIISAEQDPKAYGAMLITLGKSGVPEAKPIIDARLPDPDPNMRRWAARALRYYMIKTGEVPRDYAFPDGFPYGQPGYPAPLPEN